MPFTQGNFVPSLLEMVQLFLLISKKVYEQKDGQMNNIQSKKLTSAFRLGKLKIYWHVIVFSWVLNNRVLCGNVNGAFPVA